MRALFISLFLISFFSFGQIGKISGTVKNNLTNEPIPFAKVILVGEGKGAITFDDGTFLLDSLQPGLYTVKFSSSGFIDQILTEQNVTNARSLFLEIRLEPIVVEQKEVVVKADAFVKKAESPVSMRTLNSTEIERLPGANRDVSKVLQALPGVALRASFRNDIIIRGGSPGENKFYLDGIEVPNINHFATQGSSGGPVGLLNVNFIREVEFNSSAFPVNKANGLSSVISFKQKDGNKDALITNFALGSSDAALTFDGPLGKKADFIFSARRSYLQFLFAALQLPFLPTYNDFQYKVNFKVNEKNKVTFIGLGAIDDFKLNTKVNDKVDDPETREFNEYILGNIPTQDQWNYTVGMNWLHYSKNSYQTFILSRNMLKNIATRYFQNIETDENKLLDYSSFEAENKFRFEHLKNVNGWKFMVGFGYEFVHYNNSTFNRIQIGGTPVTVDYTSDLFLSKYSVFSQVNKNFFNDRLGLSFGLRSDVSDYSSSLLNPLDQISPVLSARYVISEKWSFNSSIGRFHQLPAYTILGYRNTNGDLVNKENNIKYIRADHYVAGLEYLTEKDSRLTVEGFYKNYTRYPFSLKDSISLANLGSDFGIIGNEEISSISTGRSYGAEFLYQQKLYKGYYGIVAYTFVTSEFKDKDDQYVASSWDSRHSVSLTGGKRFKKGWEIGLRWLFSTGAPYTPYDIATSSLKQVWDLRGQGVLDYNRLNTERESSFHQLNFRVDKKIYLQKINMDFYLDIQNMYGYKTTVAPTLLLQKDEQGNPLTDPNDPNRYLTKEVANTSGIVQPTIGVVIEFTTKKKVK
ncbi:MAG: TonB-dependent receptor [Bacteroidetes bacterium]|nr:MAG: TonB-dependent receptor [Bacteroidota bacterium]